MNGHVIVMQASNKEVCVQCVWGCATCVNYSTACSSCISSYFLIANTTCDVSCPDGFFGNETTREC